MNTSFERVELTKVEWLTPPCLVKKLGEFDLDPCSPINAPFLHAKTNYTIEDNGLNKQWFGRVYCNPPFTLLSDVGGKVSKMYDANSWLPGRSARAVVVVDKTGKISHHQVQSLSLFRPKDDEVLEAIRQAEEN